MSVSVAAAPLQPFQMVRSLQIVQDRIAAGDDAVLPMQQNLLGLIDRQMRDSDPAVFDDARNRDALIIYGLSGGNPRTLELLFPKLQLDETATRLGNVAMHYARGDFAAARSLLEGVDPRSMPPRIGAPMALVAATVTATETPAKAVAYLDDARLLSPGTLIEEAALRRSLPLSARLNDPDRFVRAAGQYARRFLESPYAGQFAEAFVSATVALHETLDLAEIEEIVALMNDEQAHVVYLRLARRSAIEGYDRLHAFASERAKAFSAGKGAEADPRTTLYANLTEVTSGNVDAVLDALSGIEPARLSAGDRELLEAAKSMARAVLDEPAEIPAQSTVFEEPEVGSEELQNFLRARIDRLEAIDALLTEETP